MRKDTETADRVNQMMLEIAEGLKKDRREINEALVDVEKWRTQLNKCEKLIESARSWNDRGYPSFPFTFFAIDRCMNEAKRLGQEYERKHGLK